MFYSIYLFSEVSFRPLHSALYYFREFRSLDSRLFFNIWTCSNAFRLLPLFVCKSLWGKHSVWSPKLLSSSCFAVVFHVSPCSEYSLWWVVELNAVSSVFRGLTCSFCCFVRWQVVMLTRNLRSCWDGLLFFYDVVPSCSGVLVVADGLWQSSTRSADTSGRISASDS